MRRTALDTKPREKYTLSYMTEAGGVTFPHPEYVEMNQGQIVCGKGEGIIEPWKERMEKKWKACTKNGEIKRSVKGPS